MEIDEAAGAIMITDGKVMTVLGTIPITTAHGTTTGVTVWRICFLANHIRGPFRIVNVFVRC